jgi:para-nitrobenzyl esterase
MDTADLAMEDDVTRKTIRLAAGADRQAALRTTGLAVMVAAVTVLATAVSVGVAAAAKARPVPGTVVRTDAGLVRGVADRNVLRFLGVPYAAPPVGALRWRAPRPVPPWRGVRPARRSGPPCTQVPSVPGQSENCLFLNVTVPELPGPKPVMVWLHGGGFTSGAGSDYNPARMAAQGDVIVVTVDFRLGMFGYFGLPGLPGSGTFGLQDQQAALRWVRANITAFGGDPHDVTLFGESGGAVATCAQLTSPAAAGLFQRAIMQSGNCQLNWPADAMSMGVPAGSFFQPVSSVDRAGQAAATVLKCRRHRTAAELACLRALPAGTLHGQFGHFGVAATGTPALPLNPATALRQGRFHRVPVLLGQNRDEHRLIAGIFAAEGWWITAKQYPGLIREAFGSRSPAVLRRYPVSRYRDDGALAWSAVFTDRIWACGQVATANALARFVPAYTYEFADEHAQPLGDLPKDFPAGASHGSELMDLFNVTGFQPITSSYYTPAQRRLATAMIAYWTAFAWTGTPDHRGAPAWPSTRPGHAEQPALQLAPGPTGIRPADAATEHQCPFWLPASR